jgi:hypothetical protein
MSKRQPKSSRPALSEQMCHTLIDTLKTPYGAKTLSRQPPRPN